MEQTLNILSEFSLCCSDEILTRSDGEGKGLFGFQVTVHHRGKPGQKLKQMPWEMLLAGFLRLVA